MIRSMTAFARQQDQAQWGVLTCELRTVNHRYLEFSFRLPEGLRELENGFREHLRKTLGRGKVDVTIRLQSSDESDTDLIINNRLAESLNEAINHVNRILDNPAHISALDILRWPGILDREEQDLTPVMTAAEALFQRTVEELVEVRAREGERLRPLFDDRLATMADLVSRVRERMPTLISAQEATLRERFRQASVDLDPDRLSQEMVILAQKSDVAEEMDRLEAHLSEVRETLQRNDAIGRRLDFLMQELNREANTLSSKSIDAEVTRIAVDMKVLIEQMREQVQNIE